jgi:hypothetical protein
VHIAYQCGKELGSGGWLLALSVLLIAATVAGPLPRRLSRPATRQ